MICRFDARRALRRQNPAGTALTMRLILSLAVWALCGPSALFAQKTAESRYGAAKDSAIRSLTARVKRGEAFAKYKPVHDSALKGLERQLRTIIGPFQANGFPGPGHINTDDLFPEDMDFGALDGLMYESADHASSVVVTTRTLLATWLSTTEHGRPLPHDPIKALGSPDFYTFAIWTDAAVSRYATIPVGNASQLGVVAAMLVNRAQDTGPFTPDQVIVSVVRGSRVFIATVPAAAKIGPPRACLAVRDSILALSTAQRERYLRSAIKDTAALDHAIKGDYADDVAYRRCYGERVPRDPAFQAIVAQVQAIAAVLPPR